MPLDGARNNIAFVPARNAHPTLATPATTPAAVAPTGIAFVPAAGRAVSLDAFEKPKTTPAATPSATPAPAKRDRPILLFNGQCEVCQALSSWVKKQDAAGGDRIDERPIGDDPEALKAIDPSLDIWDVYKEIHLVMPDGTIKKGGEAVGEVLRRLPHLGFLGPVLDTGAFGVKPAQSALNAAYKILDAARPAIGCKSCGGGPVAWWAKPIKWTADLVRAIRR
jgi:predicted DCC family thiol-disulfide oxidoreductase YuxK